MKSPGVCSKYRDITVLLLMDLVSWPLHVVASLDGDEMAINRRKDGTYSAQYYVGGERFTAPGSFKSKEQARQAARKAKASHDFRPRRAEPGKPLLFAEAAEQMLAERRVEPNTLVAYRSSLNKHVLPVLSDVPVTAITRGMIKKQIRTWEAEGKSKNVIRQAKVVISNTLQLVTEDGLIPFNPARGIDLGRSPRPAIEIPPEQSVRRIYESLPTDGARLWMLVQISTGCRLNEVRGLRPCDLSDGTLEIAWVVNELKARKKAQRPRFDRRYGTKNGDTRSITVPFHLQQEWQEYVIRHDLDGNEPLFTQLRVVPPLSTRREMIEIPTGLGQIAAPSGRLYDHGTVSAYATAKCRCDWCRVAVRQDRRQNPSYNKGSTKWRNPDEYVTESQWNRIWKRACEEAGLGSKAPTAYQLRHAHASWLIDKGQIPVKVMQRLGHRDLSVTQRYVRPVNDDRELSDALDALDIWGKKPDPPGQKVIDIGSRRQAAHNVLDNVRPEMGGVADHG